MMQIFCLIFFHFEKKKKKRKNLEAERRGIKIMNRERSGVDEE